MKTVTVKATIDLPIGAIADAVGAEVCRTIIAAEREQAQAIKYRPAHEALKQASAAVVQSLTAWEKVRHTVGERAAFDKLIATARGLRTTLETLKI